MLMHASVNILARFHAVRAMGCLFGQLYSIHTIRAAQPIELRELVIACGTLLNTLSACTSHLLVLTNVVEASKRRNSFQCFTMPQLDPHKQVSLVPRPIKVRSG